MFVTALLVALLTALPGAASPSAPPLQERLGATRLVDEAWLYLPTYDGTHRPFLSDEGRRDALVAAHLLEAAAALHPGHMRALWSLGHARVLLAEDRKNRGLADEAAHHFGRAEAALTAAIDNNAADPWAFYARGTARTSRGRHDLAFDDLEQAVETADTLLATSGDQGSVSWLRFKALEWQPEVLMRLGEFDHARAQMHVFHGEFSTNEWPLLIALAESHLRQRDLVAARAVYEQARAKYPNDSTAYEMLGYLEGLVGRRAEAATHLTEALAYEFTPGLYTRLWLWLLAPDDGRAAAREDLAGLLEHPPGETSAWDLALGHFVLGAGDAASFLAAAQEERERRMNAGEALDDLLCETWFYIGTRHELDGIDTPEATERARAAYARALAHDPATWKWEWAYARTRFAALSGDEPVASLLHAGGKTMTVAGEVAEVVHARWHAPGDEQPAEFLERAPRAGDLLLARVRFPSGGEEFVELVAGVH